MTTLTDDLTEIEALAKGGAAYAGCDHPDIQGSDVTCPHRRCVIDDGEPSRCEMSDPSINHPVTDKTNCIYWSTNLRSQAPVGADAETTLRLIERLREAEGERDRARKDSAQNNDDANLMAKGWNTASDKLRAAEARAAALADERDRLREALEMIAGQTPHDQTSKADPGREHYLRTVLISLAARALTKETGHGG